MKKNRKEREEEKIILTIKIKKTMGNLMKGIKVAAYIAEIVVASSLVIELVEKYRGKSKKRQSASKAEVDETTAETN